MFAKVIRKKAHIKIKGFSDERFVKPGISENKHNFKQRFAPDLTAAQGTPLRPEYF